VAINLALRQSYLSTGTETAAYWAFLASYVGAAIMTWMVYVRRPVTAPGLSDARPEAEAAHV
jgi:NNP family nitrate/nitrite transporter-like MFS transporter